MTDISPWPAEGPIPAVRGDLHIRRYGNEAVAWSDLSAEPVLLDPIAAVLLQIVDGQASVRDLVDDIHDVLEIDRAVAFDQTVRALDMFAHGGLLESSRPIGRAANDHDPFHGLPNDRVSTHSQLAKTPVDVAVGETAVRVLCADEEVVALLRGALGAAVTSTTAPLGFVLHVPTARQRGYVLTDRSGFVLGRTRERDQALAILAAHLSALQDPKPGSVRLRARALAAPDGSAVLAPWPLLYAPPMVEATVDAIGYRMLDRLWVDVNPTKGTLDHAGLPWPELRSLDPGMGHSSAPPEDCRVGAVLLTGGADPAEPTMAQLVHYLGTLTVSVDDPDLALAAAETVAAGARTHFVRPDDPSSIYEILAEALVDAGVRSNAWRRGSGASPVSAGVDSLSQSIEASYDELPYGSKAFPETHPVQLSTTAELRGLSTAAVDGCRVLELGCAEGGNLIPLADAYPKAEFVGIDLSSRQIERGIAAIGELDLSNIALQCIDMVELDSTFGQFDYIICHGVFSWVPEEIRSKIFEICCENAAPRGVSYISYNTYPRWHLRGMLRHAMLEAGEQDSSLVDRVATARQFLARLIDDVDPESAYGALVEAEAEAILDRTDSYIAHDYLAPVNEPLHHYQFAELAAANRLRWLGDQRIPLDESLLGGALISVDAGDPRRQAYQDLVSHNGFRAAVLCREDAPLEPELVSSRMQGFRVSTSLTAPKTLDLKDGVEATFTGRDGEGEILKTESSIVKAALKRLARSTPASLSVEELVAVVRKDLTARLRRRSRLDVGTVLTDELLSLRSVLLSRAVDVVSQPYPFATDLSARPSVSAWARYRARTETSATNRRNLELDLGDEALLRFLVQRLDGTRTVDDLVAEAARDAVGNDLLVTTGDGTPSAAADHDVSRLRSLIEDRLSLLARNAMLVA